jgi:protein tyrosine phosphatase (PTP) superfamily phosphohydrolase (DUF442 family)
MTRDFERVQGRNEVKACFAGLSRCGRFHRDTGHAVAFLAAFLLLFGLALCGAGERGLPVQEGILNFGKVDDHVFRGAQPDADGIRNLKRLGIKLIVNLRMPGDIWKDEAAEALANGILYTNIPMSGVGRPNDNDVRRVLLLFETFSAPVFIHCQHGRDRTGTVVACYRIQHDRWPNELALREAERYGISRFEYLMRRYVLDFVRVSKPDLREAKAN